MKSTQIILFFKNLKVQVLSWVSSQKMKLKEKVAKAFYSMFEREVVHTLDDQLKAWQAEYNGAFENFSNDLSRIDNMLTPQTVRRVLDSSRYEFEDLDLVVRVEKMNNKDMMSFHCSRPIVENVGHKHGGNFIWPHVECYANAGYTVSASNDEMLVWHRIGSTRQCVELEVKPFVLKITKSGAGNWDDLIPIFLEKIREVFEAKITVEN